MDYTKSGDSDRDIFYFKQALYLLCSHNTDFGVDLSFHLCFHDADSISINEGGTPLCMVSFRMVN